MKPLTLVFAAALLATAGNLAHAQESYPNRPIRIVVPFSPGGAVDGPTRVDRAGTGQAAQAAGHHREQARRRCDDRQRNGRQVRPRTATRCCWRRRPTPSARALPEAHLQADRRLRRHLAARRASPACWSCIPSLPVKNVAELVALAKAQARRAQLRVVGQRQRPAPVHGAVRVDGRHQADPRAVPRQRPGHDRSSRRPGVDVDAGHRRHGRPHQGRQAARAGGDRQQTRAAIARRADAGGVGLSRLLGLRLDGSAGAQGHARRDHAEAQRRAEDRVGVARGARIHEPHRHRGAGFDARPKSTPISAKSATAGRKVVKDTGAKVD